MEKLSFGQSGLEPGDKGESYNQKLFPIRIWIRIIPKESCSFAALNNFKTT